MKPSTVKSKSALLVGPDQTRIIVYKYARCGD